MTAKTLVWMLAVTFVAAPAWAASVEDLAGNLHFPTALISGDVQATSDKFAAAHFAPASDSTGGQTWTLSGSRVVINYTYERSLGVGLIPTNPSSPAATYETGQGSNQETFHQATGHGTGAGSDVGMLLVPTTIGAARFEASGSTSLIIETAQADTWGIGQSTNGVNATGGQRNPLDRFHRPASGDPLFSTIGAVHWRVTGDFVLNLWGSNVTVSDQSASKDYRSGRWDENVTAAKRDRYAQLIEVRVTDGTLDVDTIEGVGRWVSSEAQVTSSEATFHRATGQLESLEATFNLLDEDVHIVGALGQHIQASPQNEGRIVSDVSANAVDLQASAVAVPKATRGPLPGPYRLMTVAVGLVLLAALMIGVRMRRPMDWQALVTAADNAFLQHKNWRVRRLARRMLRTQPLASHAWFLLGTVALERKGPRALLDTLAPVALDVDYPAPLALLLTTAAVRVDDLQQAHKWLSVVRQSPEFMEAFLSDPDLGDVRRRLGVNWRPSADAGAAYA